MFAFLRGVAAEIESDRAALDVGGVGYELLCSSTTLSRLKKGQEALLYVHMNVAQDAVALYGFATKEERAMFRRLMGVSRVGPKAALSVLSAMQPADVAMPSWPETKRRWPARPVSEKRRRSGSFWN